MQEELKILIFRVKKIIIIFFRKKKNIIIWETCTLRLGALQTSTAGMRTEKACMWWEAQRGAKASQTSTYVVPLPSTTTTSHDEKACMWWEALCGGFGHFGNAFAAVHRGLKLKGGGGPGSDTEESQWDPMRPSSQDFWPWKRIAITSLWYSTVRITLW